MSILRNSYSENVSHGSTSCYQSCLATNSTSMRVTSKIAVAVDSAVVSKNILECLPMSLPAQSNSSRTPHWGALSIRCDISQHILSANKSPIQWNPNNRKKNIPQKFAETFSLLLSALSFLNWILSVCRCESNGLDQKHVINLHQTYPSLLILRPKFW